MTVASSVDPARFLKEHLAQASSDVLRHMLSTFINTLLSTDALAMKVREGGRVVNVSVMIATSVDADGHSEILGLQVASSEDGAGWLAFFRDLTARGLTGVELVISDAPSGLVAATAATLP